jgi:hypothetical protein
MSTPFLHESRHVQRGRLAFMGEEFRGIKTDAAGTDDGHTLAHRLAVLEHVQVIEHLGVVDAVDLRQARRDTGGQHHFVKVAQHGGIGAGVQPQRHAGSGQTAAK